MLSKVIFAALCAMAASRTIDVQNYSFEQFVEDFKLKYQPAELALRKANFLAELARVKMHNSKNLSWQEGINKFSAMTAAEKKAFKGRHKGAANSQGKMLKGSRSLPENFEMKPLSHLPTNVDWRKKGKCLDAERFFFSIFDRRESTFCCEDVVTAVKDQGYCGSCWAFASTEVIESHVAIANPGKLFDLSPEQIAMCAPNPDSCGGTGGCAGATAEIAFEYVTNSAGMYEEYQYPYLSYYAKDYECATPELSGPVATIDGYVQLPENNYTALMNAIASVGPIAVSVDASAWSAYKSGIFDGCNQVTSDPYKCRVWVS
jgi:cathepsin L